MIMLNDFMPESIYAKDNLCQMAPLPINIFGLGIFSQNGFDIGVCEMLLIATKSMRMSIYSYTFDFDTFKSVIFRYSQK